MHWFGKLLLGAALGVLPATVKSAEVVWWVTEPGKENAAKLAAEFEKENPDIKVKLQSNPYGGLQNKVLIALRSGIPPDVIEVQTSWIAPYVATGKLQDIGATLTGRLDPKDFVPAALASASAGDNIYGLPFQAEALAMFYRRDLYRAAGLDPDKPPLTWLEFIETAKKLTRRGADGKRVFGYGIAGGGPEGEGNTLYRSLPYIWMNGGDILSPDMKQATLNRPEAVEAIRFYTEMFTKLKVAPPSTLENDGLQLRRLFMAGAIAHYQGTPTEIERFEKDAPNLDYGIALMPHPTGKQTSALLGGWSFVVPSDGKNKTEAHKLIAFLATPERIGLYTRTFPALKSAMNLPRFADPRLNAFKQMLNHARPQPAIDSWLEIQKIYYRHVQEILIGGATAQDAMEAATREINGVLKK